MSNINEKSNRNREIYLERESGEQIVTLAKKHNLSLPRIHRICLKEENKALKQENERLLFELDTCQRKH